MTASVLKKKYVFGSCHSVAKLSLGCWCLHLAADPYYSVSISDYDLSEDPVLPPDDGSGPDDEDMSDLFTGVISGDTLRCYKCTGVTQQSGCNVTSFRQNLEDYVTKCSGHCLNISTGWLVLLS